MALKLQLWVCSMLALWQVFAASAETAQGQEIQQPPRIRPDYSGLVIPPNIAPLNFSVLEPGSCYQVSVLGGNGAALVVKTRQTAIHFPLAQWGRLLAANKGGPLAVRVEVQSSDGIWKRFACITNQVAEEDIDPVLIYRKIHPAHNAWSTMGLFQRELGSFRETPILENRRFNQDCCHCHVLRNNDPGAAIILIRSADYQNSLLIISNNQARAIQGTAAFSAFHPKSPLVVCSMSKPRLLLHTAKKNDMRDIVELEGWLGGFIPGSNVITRLPFCDPSRLLAFPAWSPDGLWLYYCSALIPPARTNQSLAMAYSSIKYDLMRVSYDAASDRWGAPEVVVPVQEFGRSVAQPRISLDGRWLFFCGTAYGCWPTYDPSSDLYGIELTQPRETGSFKWRKLELNSEETESILNWSSNSRWVVFSSKRGNPLFNRPHLAHVDANGRTSKPFIVPQEDPTFYDFALHTYTMPTLAAGPVTVPQKDIIKAIKEPKKPTLTPASVDHER